MRTHEREADYRLHRDKASAAAANVRANQPVMERCLRAIFPWRLLHRLIIRKYRDALNAKAAKVRAEYRKEWKERSARFDRTATPSFVEFVEAKADDPTNPEIASRAAVLLATVAREAAKARAALIEANRLEVDRAADAANELAESKTRVERDRQEAEAERKAKVARQKPDEQRRQQEVEEEERRTRSDETAANADKIRQQEERDSNAAEADALEKQAKFDAQEKQEKQDRRRQEAAKADDAMKRMRQANERIVVEAAARRVADPAKAEAKTNVGQSPSPESTAAESKQSSAQTDVEKRAEIAKAPKARRLKAAKAAADAESVRQAKAAANAAALRAELDEIPEYGDDDIPTWVDGPEIDAAIADEKSRAEALSTTLSGSKSTTPGMSSGNILPADSPIRPWHPREIPESDRLLTRVLWRALTSNLGKEKLGKADREEITRALGPVAVRIKTWKDHPPRENMSAYWEGQRILEGKSLSRDGTYHIDDDTRSHSSDRKKLISEMERRGIEFPPPVARPEKNEAVAPTTPNKPSGRGGRGD